jgi:hypothetical protein
MGRRAFAVAFVLLVACNSENKEPNVYDISRNPVSVRGWITDVAGTTKAETPEMEIARRTQLFQSSSVWVEGSQYASGGVAENGSFIVLDVPPGNTTIGFNAPGAETAKVVMQDIPPNADVFIPNVILENGGAKVLDPKSIVVRVPASIDKPTDTGKIATVAGYPVRIIEAPIAQFNDRRDYPSPGGFRPVAILK